jgi:hypothetical protein
MDRPDVHVLLDQPGEGGRVSIQLEATGPAV